MRRSFAVLVAGALAGPACAAREPAPGPEGPAPQTNPPAAVLPEIVAPPAHPLDGETRRLVFESPVATLEGEPSSLSTHLGKALLVVNVASKCGLTPHYEGLQRLQERYAERGFTVVGFPCNQFGEQEPGSAAEIRAFCDANYGVTFPLFEKIEVNGDGRHPVYQGLTAIADVDGRTGDIQWNFEKFVISADGERITRFPPPTDPEDPRLIAALEAAFPGGE